MIFNKRGLFFLGSVFSLTGTIIGAGIFGLPFIFSKVGWQTSLILFVFLASIILLVHFNYAYIVLRTEGKHRLAGYAQIYLGEWAKIVEIFSTIFGYIGGLLVYGILAGEFLSKLIPQFSSFELTIAFFLIGGLSIYLRQKTFFEMESILSLVLAGLFLAIIFYGISHVNSENFLNLEEVNLKNVFLAYGAILFSLSGVAVIPEIVGSFFNANLKNVSFKYVSYIIFSGTLFASLITLFFALVVVGISGANTSPDALSGLGDNIGWWIAVFGSVVGFFAIITSYIPFGVNARHVLSYDLGFSKISAILVVAFLPMILFLLGLRNFIAIIGALGVVFGGIDSILIMAIAAKIRRQAQIKPSFINAASYFVGVVFLAGIILEIYFLFS